MTGAILVRMRVSFTSFELDTTTFELLQDGQAVALEPQVFDVLVHLVTHRDRVVTKEELLDEVWGDRFVSESALTSRIKDVRRALGDDGRRQEVVRTVHGRGYRFVAPVTVVEAAATGAPAGPQPSSPVASSLPAERTPLVGRERLLEEIVGLTGEHRLVSLLGVGGTGKTRLAVAAGHRLRAGTDANVWFVDLVPVTDASGLITAVARGIGLGLGEGDPAAQLARFLDDRAGVVIVDNCEHVRIAVAELLDRLLDASPKARFLTTSREPLGLPDERRVVVPPLAVGDRAAPATEFFVASAARFGATVADGDEAVIRRLCRELDGLPLAIELAAAQLRVLSPAGVADRLDQRFELLQAEGVPGRERHASLRTVLESTWALLDDDERALVAALGAFPGAFRLVDVEQLVEGAHGPGGRGVAPTLGRLVDRALVVPDDGAGRFRLLETVRLFARQAGDAGRHADGHADWCLGRVGADIHDHLNDFDGALWCGDHYDDVRAAIRRLLAVDRVDEAARLVAATALAMHIDSGTQVADMLTLVDEVVRVVDSPALAARVHFTGVMAGMAVRSPSVIAGQGRAALDAAEVAGDPSLHAIALVLASWTAVFEDPARAVAMVEEAASLAEQAGDRRTRDMADGYRAFHLGIQHRYEEAVAQAEAVLDRGDDLPFGQDRFIALTAFSAFQVVHDPGAVRSRVDTLLNQPAPGRTMWGNQVLCSAIFAANGEVAEAVALAEVVSDRLARAGQDPFPDLLVPAAVLAHHCGERALAARWIQAVRDADRVTQSFQVTIAYRRVRQVVGACDEDPLEGRSLDEVGAEALDWMRSVAA